MSNTVPWYGEWEAAGMQRLRGAEGLASWANFNAHGGLGVYLDNKFPRNNYLRVVDCRRTTIAERRHRSLPGRHLAR